MSEFNEQVVKRVNKPKNLIIKILSIVLLITVPVLCAFLAVLVQITYLIYVGFFIFLGGIYAVWYVFSLQKVEYEYTVLGDELRIAKIISLRKRKKVCSVPIKSIETLEKDEKSTQGKRFLKTFTAARDIDRADENYFLTYNDSAYGKSLLVFSPNEDILLAMKPHLKKDIVIKLFYNRNAG
ncbi:MAG: hypothetical protein LUF33_06340 [Clostridiales bacterium]|nr:hypothetical protein [Clostridiales bacterium]